MEHTLTHRRHSDKLSNGFVILFAEENNDHYGDHVWTLKTELPKASESKELIEFTSEYYGIGLEEAEELVNPSDIVDSAGAFDDSQFVSDLWDALEPTGYRTFDGAVVLDREEVELEYIKES